MLNKYYFGPGEQYNSLNEVIEAINSSVITDDVIIYASYQLEPYRLINEIILNHSFKTTITSKDKTVIFTGKEVLPNTTFIKAVENEEPDSLVKVWKSAYDHSYDPDIYEDNVLLKKCSDYEMVYETPGSYCVINNYLYIHASDSSKVRINNHLYEIVTRDFIIKSSNNLSLLNIDFEYSRSYCVQLSGNHIFNINKCRFKSNYGSIELSNSQDGFIIENNSFINDVNSNNLSTMRYIYLVNIKNNGFVKHNYLKTFNSGGNLIYANGLTNSSLNILENILINGDIQVTSLVNNLVFERNISRKDIN